LANGAKPESKLLRDSTGALFGTTYMGGTGLCKDGAGNTIGCGAVFRLLPPLPGQTNWRHSILLIFNGANGAYPEGGVVADLNGNLYGVTTRSNTNIWGLGGNGVAYKLTRPPLGQTVWMPAVLYYFQLATSGYNTLGELVRAPDGRLYGVALSGGR
jgi:hypothetical protein